MIYHGAAWYPELWPERVDDDLRLMKEAGINLIRAGEFAWSAMEPQEGVYDLNWLGEALDKCLSAGIKAILCTPTPTPPRWLTEKYPETMRIDSDGLPYVHGSRQHVSHTSPVYRRFSRQITEKLAQAFGGHPALIAWQLDNEFLCHVDGDFSDSARSAWHSWLQTRYGAIEALNQAWGAGVWSQTYQSFEQVPLPRKTPFHNEPGTQTGQHNCSLELHWGLFVSDTVVEFAEEQAEIIRRYSSAPITHNHIKHERLIAQDLFENLDFAATDFYAEYTSLWRTFRTLDWMRGAKMNRGLQTAPYMVLETAPSHNGAVSVGHRAHPRGFLAAEALIFLGMGGNAFCYWLWRQQRGGAEMCHGSVITAWGTPSVGWREVKGVTALIQSISPILRDLPPAPAPLAVHDPKRSRVHLLRAEQFSDNCGVFSTQRYIYRPLLELGFWRDIRFENADVSSYRAVISPFMPILTDELIDRMEAFMAQGGTWIVGPLSGVRTADGCVPVNAGLGRLDAIAGVRSLWPTGLCEDRARLGDAELPLSGYAIGLELTDGNTETVGTIQSGPAAGAVWFVRRRVGKGRIVLITAFHPDHMNLICQEMLRDINVMKLEASWGTTIIPREGAGKRAWLIANWDGEGGTAMLPQSGRDLISGDSVKAGRVTVEPFQSMAILAG